jgi:hypothetical protein
MDKTMILLILCVTQIVQCAWLIYLHIVARETVRVILLQKKMLHIFTGMVEEEDEDGND